MTFEQARAAYPVLERTAYLNAGTFGPLAQVTLDAVADQQRAELERGRGGKAYFERMLGLRESVRARLASVLGVEAQSVALTSSTTESCNLVLGGLGLEPGDEVVTTDCEHFGLIGALAVSSATLRIAAIRDRPVEGALDAIQAEISPRTRLLALSHVAWTTGNRLPLENLRGTTELPILVDGAQSAGAIPVDASRFDFYTVSAQKWLCGPDATGGLFVREPERLALTAPSYFSQAGYDLAEGTFEPKPGAARFDPGWISTASLAGLEAALELHPGWGFERAAEMAARCRRLLEERFHVVTAPGQATLVSIRAPGDPAEMVLRAYEQGVVVRDLPGTGLLRVSCGYWTSDDDLERLLAALDAR